MGGMAGSGQGNPLGNALVRTGIGFGGQAPTPPTPAGAQFTPVTPNVYTPAFSSVQNNRAPIAATPQTTAQQAGLQALMSNMMARYGQVPGSTVMQAPRAPMPVYRPAALSYRPNMQPAQASLGRVAVSVAEQQRRAAQAELDRIKAESQFSASDQVSQPNYGGA